MTRLEQAQQRAEKAAKALAKARRTETIEAAKARGKARLAVNKRRYHVGALADEAGLFVLDNTTLGHLFALLTPLVGIPDIVGTLEGLLADPYLLAMAESNHEPTAIAEGF